MLYMTFDKTRKYYVYVWYIVDPFEIIYVGKGTGNRYKTRKRENSYFTKMIQTHDCDSMILLDGLTEEEAFSYEKAIISGWRNLPIRLTNIQDGGEQPPNAKGIKRSQSTKDKMSEAMIRFYENHPEVREKASRELKEFLNTDKGKEFQRKSIMARDNDDFRKAQSERCRRANRTPEYLERQSKIVKDMWKSEEYANAHRGANNHRSQGVKQYDLDGNFIQEYETITQASQSTGVDASKISLVCKGKRKTSGGYVWKYSNDKHIVLKRTNTYDPSKDKMAKAVLQYDMDGNIIAEYYSINDASRKNPDMLRSAIQQNLRGKSKSAYGFVWKYK